MFGSDSQARQRGSPNIARTLSSYVDIPLLLLCATTDTETTKINTTKLDY